MTNTLPDFLTTETSAAILTRMLATLSNDIDKAEGSYIYDAIAAVAVELAQMKIDMSNFLTRGFASTTFGEYLDMRCAEHGITRNEAAYATGTVTFTGTAGTTIALGAVVATPADQVLGISSVEFATTSSATVGVSGTVNVAIKARVAGEDGNVLGNTITILSTPINGISAVTNSAATTGGEEQETDTALLARYLSKVQNPGTSGNKADYKNWALAVPGVGDAQVIPLWNGPGTVKIAIIDEDKLPANNTTVAAVKAYIDADDATGESEAPIGATVTVVAAAAVSINITAAITITEATTLQEAKTAFETALQEYLAGIAFSTTDPMVKYTKIGHLLLDIKGVTDYSNLLVNGAGANIVITAGEVPVKGTVTLS